MLKFEEYLADFNNTINLLDFGINLVVAAILTLALKWFYIKYGTFVGNRDIIMPFRNSKHSKYVTGLLMCY